MNPFSSGSSLSGSNPFSSGIPGSGAVNPFSSNLSNPSLQSGQSGGIRPGFSSSNPANPSSTSSGFRTSQVSNPFSSSSGSITGFSQSNPFTAAGGFPSGSGGQYSSSSLSTGPAGRLTSSVNPTSSGFNTSFSGQGLNAGTFSGSQGNVFSSSGIPASGTNAANPFSSSMGNSFPSSGNPLSASSGNSFPSSTGNPLSSNGNPFSSGTGNPFSNVATGSIPTGSGFTTGGSSVSGQVNLGPSGQGFSSSQNPFSSAQNPLSSAQNPFSSVQSTATSNPFSSSFPGSATSIQPIGLTSSTSNPSFANPSSGFFVSNNQSNPFSSGGFPSIYSTSSGPVSMTSNMIPSFSSNFEEPGIWRYKKIDSLSANMKKIFFDLQKSFDKNSDSLSNVEKTSKIVKEKIKKTLENAERILNYSTKVQTVHKRTKLSIEIVKKFENEIVGYVRDIIKVCEFCERADYYNQITSPADFVSCLLQSCDNKLEQLDESLAQVEDMIKFESDPNSFKELCQVLVLMNEKFKVVAGLSYDLHVMIDQLYEKLKFRFKELQNFHPEIESNISQVKLEYKENKENSQTAHFRPTGNIKDLISAYPSHSILK